VVLKTEYKGDWKAGRMDGLGNYTTLSGNKYSGHWKENKRHGRGEFVLVDGTVFRGKWVEDNFTCHDGFLAMNRTSGVRDRYPQASPLLADNTSYTGGVLDGLMHNEGTIQFIGNRKFLGTFSEGRPLSGSFVLKDASVFTLQSINDSWDLWQYKCAAEIVLDSGPTIAVHCNLEDFRFEVVPLATKAHATTKEKRENNTHDLPIPTQKAGEIRELFNALCWFEYHFFETKQYLKSDIFLFDEDRQGTSTTERKEL